VTAPELFLVEEFLNTIDERTFGRHGDDPRSRERLTSPDALSEWLAGHGLAGDAPLLPEDLSAAVTLRSALREAATSGAEVAPALDRFPLHLAPGPDGGLRLAADSGVPGLDTIVETVARTVAGGGWSRLKLCAAPDCHWAFYDQSRSGGGRWCSMAACGNRHKTRTYRQRRRAD
jgi:predicted RNA-binding Zn ribbon-like protein